MYCCQDPPILHQFQTCICLAGPETWNWKSSSVRLVSSSSKSVVSISGGSSGTFLSGVDLSRPRGWKRITQLYSTAYDNNSFRVPNIQVVYWLRTVVLSYAGQNSVVLGPKHCLLQVWSWIRPIYSHRCSVQTMMTVTWYVWSRDSVSFSSDFSSYSTCRRTGSPWQIMPLFARKSPASNSCQGRRSPSSWPKLNPPIASRCLGHRHQLEQVSTGERTIQMKGREG